MGLDIALMYHRSRKRVFDDDVRLAKAGFEVALTPGDIDKIVGRLLERLGQPFVANDIGVNHFRARLQRFNRIEQRFGLFVLDFDQVRRLFSNELVVRRHCRDLFADEPDLPVGKDRHIVEPPADFQSGAILSRDDSVHARKLFGLAGVDAFDLP